jgi:predicted nucleic acid-binding protein
VKRLPPLILDSWAILALYGDEPSAAKVEELLIEAQARERNLLMTTINLAEVWYVMARRLSSAAADSAVEDLAGLGVRFMAADAALARAAAQLKVSGGISLGDAFAAALAEREHGILVTGDKEFGRIGKKISIHWL